MVKVSVVMPVYNGERFIRQAIASILNQTFKDFELIIVDDGSFDNSVRIIKTFKDKRIKLFRNNKNLGLVPSLNKGINVAKGEYIARCDSDDINLSERFLIQADFLDKDKDYILVGSGLSLIDEKGKNLKEDQVRKGYTNLPITDRQIRKTIFIRNCVVHPTVMIRTKILKKVGGYRDIFNLGAEEYDLWFRLLRVGKFYNIPKNLIKRRIHSDVYTNKHHLRVELMALMVRVINLPVVLRFLW